MSAPVFAPTCQYCGYSARLVTGAEVYQHRSDLSNHKFWLCSEDSAWVGCHPGTVKPLGRLANAELRAAKQQAHAAFDPIWQSCEVTRREAYAWLAYQLGIDMSECHIGMFDVSQCYATVKACEKGTIRAE
jgi:hypothetical protein